MELEGKRLNKYIADAGYCSRREADRLIEAGKVEIRRKSRRDEPEHKPFRASLGDRVFSGDTVIVSGTELPKKEAKKIYLLLNKPKGIVCTSDLSVPDNVIAFVGERERITYAGRLDKDSEGLLLLTNDGDLINAMMHAENRHEKEYVVTVDKNLTDDFLKEMASGVKIRLDDEANLRKAEERSGKAGSVRYVTTRPCRVRKLTARKFAIVLTQGYNRQIRRMCAALGWSVESIVRVRVMNLRLGDLRSGQVRILTESEKKKLMSELEIG